MKAFLIGTATLITLITIVCINALYISRDTRALLSLVEGLENSTALADTSSLCEKWESSKKLIALSVHRETIDSIDDSIAQLTLAVKTGNESLYHTSREQLLCIIKRLRETESFSLKRIF